MEIELHTLNTDCSSEEKNKKNLADLTKPVCKDGICQIKF